MQVVEDSPQTLHAMKRFRLETDAMKEAGVDVQELTIT